MAKRHLALAVLLIPLSFLITHCTKDTEEPTPNPPKSTSSTAPVLSEHRFKPASKEPLKALGESCSASGPAECISNVCIHLGTSRESGYICSQRCDQDSPCPQGWRCGRLHPSDPTAAACLPYETPPDTVRP